MDTVAIGNVTSAKGKRRFVGIKRAARKLGRSRQHLYYVLIGARKSPLLREIRKMVREEYEDAI